MKIFCHIPSHSLVIAAKYITPAIVSQVLEPQMSRASRYLDPNPLLSPQLLRRRSTSIAAQGIQPSGKTIGLDKQGNAIYQAHANGIEIGYKLIGSGEPLVMIPWLGGTMDRWPREVIQAPRSLGGQPAILPAGEAQAPTPDGQIAAFINRAPYRLFRLAGPTFR